MTRYSSRRELETPLCPPQVVSFFGLTLLIGSVLFGCALHRAPAEESQTDPALESTEIAVVDPNPAAAFAAAIQQMAVSLFSHLGDADPRGGDLADGIAVTSFVDLGNLNRTSAFGRYLAEQLMTEFQQQGYRVVDIRKSTSITVQEKRGEFGLSRDVAEISPAVRARTMITGTYTLAGDHILVNAKVLDSLNAVMLSSATMVFPRTREADQLLADSATLSSRRRGAESSRAGMTAMKQL